jgi:predicted outer membrane protein
MNRTYLVLAIACSACSAHREMRGLDDVTTTSAVIRPAPPTTVEAPIAEDQTASSMPTPIAASTTDDVAIAGAVERTSDAAVQRADLALRYVRDNRVRDFAQLVRDRNHDAKTGLSFIVASPDVAQPPAALSALAAQSQIDFDRAYVDMELRATNEELSMLDEVTPRATTPELRKRLMDLRPQLADLYARAYELQQVLVTAPFTPPR